ncbi:hypothetical protein QUF80_20490 [Desulfococcaceae bacterium HSG8]|nr:hypothetical protein [Desulfococcaceae bacterium HSG8]
MARICQSEPSHLARTYDLITHHVSRITLHGSDLSIRAEPSGPNLRPYHASRFTHHVTWLGFVNPSRAMRPEPPTLSRITFHASRYMARICQSEPSHAADLITHHASRITLHASRFQFIKLAA